VSTIDFSFDFLLSIYDACIEIFTNVMTIDEVMLLTSILYNTIDVTRYTDAYEYTCTLTNGGTLMRSVNEYHNQTQQRAAGEREASRRAQNL